MERVRNAALAAALALAASFASAEEGADIAAVTQLGRVNGTALACDRPDLVTKARALMGARVPKTRRYGEAFEAATDAAFRDMGKEGATCPPDVVQSLAFEAADLKMADAFPPTASYQVDK